MFSLLADLSRTSQIPPKPSLSASQVHDDESQPQQEPLGVSPERMAGRLSGSQKTILEAAFTQNPSPHASTRARLAVQTGIPSRVVQVWFQNRRAKAKMLQTRSSSAMAVSDDPSSADIDMLSDDEDVDLQFSQDYVLSSGESEPEDDQIMRSDSISAARFTAFSASSIWTEDRILKEAVDALESIEARRYEDPRTMNEPGNRWANLNKEISKAARAVPFFDQSAIYLAKQCSILVNSHSKWASQFENVMQVEPGKRSSPEEVNHFSTVQFGLLVAEEMLERDLTRILEFLSILVAQPAQAFRETRLFSQLFTSAWDYLTVRRLFANYAEEDVIMSRIKLQKAIRYDLNEATVALGQKGNWAPNLTPTTGGEGLPSQGRGMQRISASLKSAFLIPLVEVGADGAPSSLSPGTEPVTNTATKQPQLMVAEGLSLGSQIFPEESAVARGYPAPGWVDLDIATTANNNDPASPSELQRHMGLPTPRKYRMLLDAIVQRQPGLVVIEDLSCSMQVVGVLRWTATLTANGLGPFVAIAPSKREARDKASYQLLQIMGWDLNQAAPYEEEDPY